MYGDRPVCHAYDCALGADRITTRDGKRDAVHCGVGADRAKVDRKDVVAKGKAAKCERLKRKK